MTNQNKVAIRFMAEINPQTTNLLISIIENKIREGKNTIILLISSPGGQVASGIAAYNYLKSLPATLETHNFGNVDSIASMIFCSGSKRTCNENASFLIHSVAWSGNANFEEKHFKEILGGLQIDRQNISEIIAKNCHKDPKIIKGIMLKGKHLNAKEAKKLGLIDEIIDYKIEPEVEIVSIG